MDAYADGDIETPTLVAGSSPLFVTVTDLGDASLWLHCVSNVTFPGDAVRFAAAKARASGSRAIDGTINQGRRRRMHEG